MLFITTHGTQALLIIAEI